MKVFADAELCPIKAGVEARIASVRLAGHGYDSDMAIDSLRRAMMAWCRGLARLGELERALRARGLTWEADGDAVELELRAVDAPIPMGTPAMLQSPHDEEDGPWQQATKFAAPQFRGGPDRLVAHGAAVTTDKE